MSILATILTSLTQVGRLVGKPFQEWSEWAEANPEAAALQLGLIASRLEGRADAIEQKRGPKAWRVRKNRAMARRLRAQARSIVSRDPGACSVPPGRWEP